MKNILEKGIPTMKRNALIRFSITVGTLVSVVGLAIAPAAAVASRPGTTNSNGSTNNAAAQARLQLIINRGNNEISRRLTTLNTLSDKINSAAKLSTTNKNLLNNEVSSAISGLTSLKTKLDAETTVSGAQSDAQSIINDYRVYALVVPKVYLVKTADDQQVAEGKLSDLATKLQSRITTAKNNGKQVTSLQSSLDDLNNKVSSAQAISSKVESSVINLQPSDYNSNHSVLSGDRNQLKTAQNNIQGALSDAKNIVTGLKNL